MAILELETPIEEWSDFIMPACIHHNGLGLFSHYSLCKIDYVA